MNFKVVKQILRNIKGTLNYGIRILDESSISLYAFVNSDWARCLITRRSTISFCVYLGANCISLSSKKQGTVEYCSMAIAAIELT